MTAAGADALRVYWRPGCSSCVKVKEFLSQLGVEYESINVAAVPGAMDELHELGVRTVPVVARGREYVFAQALEDVSAFVGRSVSIERLPPGELIAKWLAVLSASQANVLQLPASRLAERATPGRDRSIRDLAYHVFQIADAFLQVSENGLVDWTTVANAPPPGRVTSVEHIRAYGAGVAERLKIWWESLEDRSCARPVKMYYGTHPLHQFLERSTWHSAQHARQIIAVLEGFGIEPARRLTGKDYAGLPMPEGLWE
jgi:glutaredoxin